jgi:hypothetical protein
MYRAYLVSMVSSMWRIKGVNALALMSNEDKFGCKCICRRLSFFKQLVSNNSLIERVPSIGFFLGYVIRVEI